MNKPRHATQPPRTQNTVGKSISNSCPHMKNKSRYSLSRRIGVFVKRRVMNREMAHHHDPRHIVAVGVGRGEILLEPRDLIVVEVVEIQSNKMKEAKIRRHVPATRVSHGATTVSRGEERMKKEVMRVDRGEERMKKKVGMM